MTIVKTESSAKINLTLEVIRKMSNGFHELRMIMIKLFNLKDDLEFEIKSGERKITIECDNPEIPVGKENICHKAVTIFLNKLEREIEILIKIKKRIPVGAGLGGGSSNAASTFLVLNEYFKKPFSKKQLIEMAVEVGKDVPFFLSEKDGALIQGAGEIIKESFNFSKGCFLLVNPGINISTKEAYGKVSKKLKLINKKNRINISDKMLTAIKNKTKKSLSNYFYNDFEKVIEKEHLIIKKIKQNLLNLGATGALMSGSGSTVFGWFENLKKAKEAKKMIKNKYQDFLVEIG